MASAPKNPFIFSIFLGIVLIAILLLDGVFKVPLYPKNHKPFYPTRSVPPEIVKAKKEIAEKELGTDSIGSQETDPIEKGEEPVPKPEDIAWDEKLAQYRDSIQETLITGKKRTDIIIRYYPHLPDGDHIYALRELGFYLHERPTDPNRTQMPSNALYYGDNVSLEDIQLVAITLINEGIPLKQIRLSRFHDSWKSDALEIGAEEGLDDQPVLSKSDIENFEKE